MQKFKGFLKSSLAIAAIAIAAAPALTQSGNQSDITGPTIEPPPDFESPQSSEENPVSSEPGVQQEQPQQGPPGGNNQPPPGDGQPQQGPPGGNNQPPPGQGQPPPPGQGQPPPPGQGQPPPPGQGQPPPPGQGQPPPPGQGQPPPPPRLNPPALEPQIRPEPPPGGPPKRETSEGRDARPVGPMKQQIDRPGYEAQLQQAELGVAVQLIEEFQAVEFGDYLGVELFGNVPSIEETSQMLAHLWSVTGKKAAFIYVSSLSDSVETLTIFPKMNPEAEELSQAGAASSTERENLTNTENDYSKRNTTPEVSREELLDTIQKFRIELTNPRMRNSKSYLKYAQQLYQWIIKPIEAQIQEQGIDTLVFSMDSGLRSIPIAALHDGEQFLVEKYGAALVPSLGLTDIRYSDASKQKILAMGASQFTDLNPLPAVPIELQTILKNPWQGELFLNESFTSENFQEKNHLHQFGIIHLATHAEFKAGDLNNSYIKFFNDRITLEQFRQIASELGWNSPEYQPIELLVLSACKTAVGNREAELGFAGLAVLSGVKTALASLWYVSDAGTLGLMSEFYNQLSETPLKAEALRRSQLAMLRGEVRVENGMLRLSNGETVPLPEELAKQSNLDLSHPYFWSAFLTIGNWN